MMALRGTAPFACARASEQGDWVKGNRISSQALKYWECAEQRRSTGDEKGAGMLRDHLHRGDLLERVRVHRDEDRGPTAPSAQLAPSAPRARPPQRAGLWLRLCLIFVYPLVVVFFRRDVRGGQRIASEGPAIIVANHVSHVDPVVLASIVWDRGWRPRFLAKASLFNVPVIGRAIRGTGQVPVHRGSVDARTSLREALDVLRAGGRILIYPEGTVTRDAAGWPMEGKTGAARLALLMPDVPVIPVGQWGVQTSVDLYKRRLRLRPRRHVVYSVGDPVDLSAFAGQRASHDVLRDATATMMGRIRELVEQSRSAT
jgi:1-acyl-sn-glycerol-3-phosphate acyltransferase